MLMIPRRSGFDLLEDMFEDPIFSGESKMMKTDIKEKDGNYLIDVDLPGYDKENIKVEVEDGYLTIHATMKDEKKDEENGKFIRRERYFGECSRSFYVGDSVQSEDIEASFKNGTLSLTIPNVKEIEKPEKKYIEIK